MSDATSVVRRFNDAISAADLEELGALMSADHVFIDSAGSRVVGRGACLDTWRDFFASFPDYQNVFDRVIVGDDAVLIVGRSSCSDPALDGPALWRAVVDDGRVREWQVADDTPASRRALGIVD